MRNRKFMRMAIALARKGIGKTSPNPAVGAVIVKNGRVVGSGYHRKAGLAHAEINALREAGIKAKGADIYITLEPCNHFGRTPPCAEAIVKAGIKNIFIGMKDPNPLVAGKGITRLKNAGMKVETGILEQECKYINEAYIKYIITKTPFVTLKLASTLDGKIATASGESKWITGETARRYAHRMRAEADAVMVGIGTVIADDPELTVRLVKGENPVRIVVDSRLRMPANAKILNQQKGSVIIATTKNANSRKVKSLEARGIKILARPSKMGEVDLKALMKELGKREITSLIIEGGGSLAASAIKEGIVDKIAIFVAPKFFGKEGLSMIGELGIKKMSEAICLRKLQCKKIGEDILVKGYLER